MLKIRLQRVGRKNDASFRLVVIESTKAPQAGNALEILGSYNPKNDMKAVKADRVKHWISVGAQVSDSAHNLLVSEGIIDGKKINVLPKKSPVVDEEALAKAAEEEEAKKKEAEEKAAAEKEAEKAKEEAPAEAEVSEEAPEEKKEEAAEEAPKEEEKPADEAKEGDAEEKK